MISESFNLVYTKPDCQEIDAIALVNHRFYKNSCGILDHYIHVCVSCHSHNIIRLLREFWPAFFCITITS
jgi:hypothetical protein